MPRKQLVKIMRFRLPCDEANHICDKSQYKEASLFEKLKLQLHLLYCRACREYSARNQKLSTIINNANIKAMPKGEKDHLKEKLRQEINK